MCTLIRSTKLDWCGVCLCSERGLSFQSTTMQSIKAFKGFGLLSTIPDSLLCLVPFVFSWAAGKYIVVWTLCRPDRAAQQNPTVFATQSWLISGISKIGPNSRTDSSEEMGGSRAAAAAASYLVLGSVLPTRQALQSTQHCNVLSLTMSVEICIKSTIGCWWTLKRCCF